MVVEVAVAAMLSAAAIGFGAGRVTIGGGPTHPLLAFGAMDESVYSHAAARMVRTGRWATPVYLDRVMMNKPPLVMWAGAASMRLLGISRWALLLPVIGAGALCCVLVYVWLRRSRPVAVALAGMILVAGTPLFHTVARRFTTDVLLVLFLAACALLLRLDPRLDRRWAAVVFGALCGAAVLTKSVAGLMPLLVLFGYWAVAGRANRPAGRRVLLACAAAAAVSLPWHIYEFITHRNWFLTEYLGAEILEFGGKAPANPAGGLKLWYYLHGLLATDPLLVLLAVTAAPGMVRAWRKGVPEARLLAVWIVVVCACLAAYGNRSTYYLAPLLPALALAAQFSPLLKGRAATVGCVVLVAAFAVKLWAGEASWGLSYRTGGSSASTVALDRYSGLRRANELVIVDPDDEYYSSVIDLPKVRYVFVVPEIDYRKTVGFFYYLGVVMLAEDFCNLETSARVYGPRLRAWRCSEAALATSMMAKSAAELGRMIACSPERDFLLPEKYRSLAAGPAHSATAPEWGRFFLLANRSGRRPEGAVAVGAIPSGAGH